MQTVRDTGPAGAYLFDHVDPGNYSLTAEMQGFSRQTRQDVTADFSLKPGSLVETGAIDGSRESVLGVERSARPLVA